MNMSVVELQERQIKRKKISSSPTCHSLSNIQKCVLMQVVINVRYEVNCNVCSYCSQDNLNTEPHLLSSHLLICNTSFLLFRKTVLRSSIYLLWFLQNQKNKGKPSAEAVDYNRFITVSLGTAIASASKLSSQLSCTARQFDKLYNYKGVISGQCSTIFILKGLLTHFRGK